MGFGPGSAYDVKWGVFSDIQEEFNEEWMQKLIIEKGLIFKMPFGIGSILCKKYKMKIRLNKDGTVDTRRLPVDWGKSKQKWAELWPGFTSKELKEIKHKPIVYSLNEHSDGYRYTIFWDKKGSGIKNKMVYNFVPNRKNHRYLAKVAKDPDIQVDYYDRAIPRRKWKKRKWKKYV